VARRQKHDRPRKRSDECAGDVDSRSTSRCKVTEGRARDRGADDTKCEIQYDILTGTLEDPESYVAGRQSEKDEDND